MEYESKSKEELISDIRALMKRLETFELSAQLFGHPDDPSLNESDRMQGLNGILNAINDGVFILNEKGDFTFINEVIEKRSGIPGREFTQLNFMDVVIPEERPKIEEKFKRLMAGEDVGPYDLTYKTVKGENMLVEINCKQLYRNGRIVGMLGISRDVTAKRRALKALNQERKQLLSIFDSIDEPIYVSDPQDFEILYANKALQKVVGDAVGRKCYKALQGLDAPCSFCTNKYIFGENRSEVYIWEFRNKINNRWYHCIDRAIKWPDGREVRYEMAIDITDRVTAEEELCRAYEQMEDRVRQRTEELENAVKDLKSFTYTVSHDLRSPLRSIHGYSEMLLQDHSEKLDGKSEIYLTQINNEAVRMGQLIDDLLTFSRLGRQELIMTNIDMDKLLEIVLKETTQHANTKNAIFECSKLPRALGDQSLIRQVLVNLISNALKFSGKEQKSIIKIKGHAERDQNVYSVEDNGVGFDMIYADRLFQVFYRLHPQTEFAGTGVGLAIIKRIIEKHKGQVWAESEPGKGAIFYFTLPTF